MINRAIILFATLVCFFILPINVSLGKVIYVDSEAFGSNNGSSWENAYIYLQDALADAKNSDKPVEILAAQGIYKPDKGANQQEGDYTASFELINGVVLSGGYAGVSENDPNARDITLYPTILSGDLLDNDAVYIDPNNYVNEPTCFDNSFHVIRADSANNTAIIDGFTIKSGVAGGYYLAFDSTSKGGGIYINSVNGNPENLPGSSGPVISNCTFISNAAYKGGAIYNENSDPNIINCKFIGNFADTYLSGLSEQGGKGGAIDNNDGNSILTNCEFTDNFSSWGGGVCNSGNNDVVFVDCSFVRNIAIEQGGGLFNNMGEPILRNCIFSENSALNCGGGLANKNFSKPVVANCTFLANQAVSSGGAIYNHEYSEPNITNCSFTQNLAVIGGGIANENSDIKIKDCSFNGNQGYYGGCFVNSFGNPIFSNCIFSNNTADNKAGVIQNFFGNAVFLNCIFSGNSAIMNSGAILNTAGYLKFSNCTLLGNKAGISGNAIQNTSLPIDYNSYINGSIDFLNCIIWNGQKAIQNLNGSSISINYSDVESGLLAVDNPADKLTWGQGNIVSDPCFVESGHWVDVDDTKRIVEPNDINAVWLEGDYHLKSTAGHYDPNTKTWIIDDENSPCIDAGDPNSLVADEPLPNGGRINMGAYGGTTQASMSPGESLVVRWKLDEMEGETAHDSAGDNDANVFQAKWVVGKINEAIQFDGNSTYMDCGYNRMFSTAQTTISFWLKPAENDEITYILNRASLDLTSIDYNLILFPDGKVELGIGQGNTESAYLLSNSVVPPEVWTHITITLNGSAANIYINGQFDNSIDYSQRDTSGDYNLIIGSFGGLSNFYRGMIDDIRIYNRALSRQQIVSLAQ